MFKPLLSEIKEFFTEVKEMYVDFWMDAMECSADTYMPLILRVFIILTGLALFLLAHFLILIFILACICHPIIPIVVITPFLIVRHFKYLHDKKKGN